MYKKALAALVAALVSGVLLGLLGGCGVATEASIVDIQTFRQTSNQVEMTNYQVNFKQTPDEWIALSTKDKEKLTQLGFDKALEQIAADGTSSYNISGMTAAGTDADGGATKPQSAFFLNRERGLLLVHSGVDDQKQPVVVSEIPVELP
jgi:hypothetical protein